MPIYSQSITYYSQYRGGNFDGKELIWAEDKIAS